jgi:NhaA family Na+:H+ antiporter
MRRSNKELDVAVKGNFFYRISDFFKNETSSGILVLIFAVLGIIIANSPWGNFYFNFWNTDFFIKFGDFEFKMSLLHFVNDILMFFFFFLVGMEIKREMLVGELSSLKKSLLPVIAATGGVLFPIIIYSLINWGKDSFRGWGIPMATDIAFTIAVMMLLGNAVSHAVKANITALAIADDIMALIVIALFYSVGVKLIYVVIALLVVAILIVLNKVNLANEWVYLVAGIVLWVLFYNSGVHPTIAGVLLAFVIPTKIPKDFEANIALVSSSLKSIMESYKKGKVFPDTKVNFSTAIEKLKNSEPYLQRFESSLAPFVSFVVLPIFAFSNSGVYVGNFSINDLFHPVVLGVALGLMFGKSTGIFTFSYLSIKLKITDISSKVRWSEYYGASWLAGIGFTMALFIAHLSFDQHPRYLDYAKVGIYLGSVISAIVGSLIIILTNGKKLAQNVK